MRKIFENNKTNQLLAGFKRNRSRIKDYIDQFHSTRFAEEFGWKYDEELDVRHIIDGGSRDGEWEFRGAPELEYDDEDLLLEFLHREITRFNSEGYLFFGYMDDKEFIDILNDIDESIVKKIEANKAMSKDGLIVIELIHRSQDVYLAQFTDDDLLEETENYEFFLDAGYDERYGDFTNVIDVDFNVILDIAMYTRSILDVSKMINNTKIINLSE